VRSSGSLERKNARNKTMLLLLKDYGQKYE